MAPADPSSSAQPARIAWIDDLAALDLVEDGARAAARNSFVTKFERNLTTSAHAAAARILRGKARCERRVVIGADARLADLMARLLPSSYDWVVGRLVKGLD